MANALQAIRGMNDILPDRSFIWQFAEDNIRAVIESYGFREIRMPIGEGIALPLWCIDEQAEQPEHPWRYPIE